MKRILLLLTSVLMIASVAAADHIGVYSDATGESCWLSQGISTATLVHKFSTGATGSRFRIALSDGIIFTFNTPYTKEGDFSSDMSVEYGQCHSGSFAIGEIFAILEPGVINVWPVHAASHILVTDCSLVTKNATGGGALVGSTGTCPIYVGPPVPTEGATWGKVKSLYR